MSKHKRLRICIAASAGGHLTQAIMIAAKLREKYSVYLVTYRLPHFLENIEGLPTFFVINPHISYWKYLVNFFQALKIIMKQRPDVVLSTGSGAAIATCLLGKFLGAKLIYVESGSRVVTPSRTGKLLYRFADLFLVQWPSLQRVYPRSIVGGPLI